MRYVKARRTRQARQSTVSSAHRTDRMNRVGQRMSVPLIWTLQDWASAVETLPSSPGPLPERRVVVPNGRVTHALRRELVERGSAQTLIGTRFLTPLQLARELLLDSGESSLEPNDADLGPMLVREAFARVPLQRFTRDDLLHLPGWDLAFCRTLRELDDAEIEPKALVAHADPHVSDVGRVHALLRERNELITPAAILQRAAVRVSSRSDRIPTLAVLNGFESPAELQLLRALNGLFMARWAVRPRRAEQTRRTTALCGESFGEPMSRASDPASTALQQLQLRLFDDAAGTPSPDDDTVRIAIYSGVHEEVEAAVSWVAEQLLRHGVPAQQIAILSAAPEPYGTLLRSRLGMLAAYSEHGVPVAERADGTRLLLTVRALGQGLARDALAPLLPLIRVHEEKRGVNGLSHAWQVLNAVAAVGGTSANLGAGCSWAAAWTRAG